MLHLSSPGPTLHMAYTAISDYSPCVLVPQHYGLQHYGSFSRMTCAHVPGFADIIAVSLSPGVCRHDGTGCSTQVVLHGPGGPTIWLQQHDFTFIYARWDRELHEDSSLTRGVGRQETSASPSAQHSSAYCSLVQHTDVAVARMEYAAGIHIQRASLIITPSACRLVASGLSPHQRRP